MCPTARSRRDIYNEHVQIEKGKIGLETSKVRMSLRNEHFQNAARGPLKYGAPGPARRILKMLISKIRIGGDEPLIGMSVRVGLLVYIIPVNLFT